MKPRLRIVSINDVDLDTIGGRLRYARAKAGFRSAAEFADRLDMPYSTYVAHENGVAKGFKAASAARYAKALKVEVNWLLFGETKASEPSFDARLAAIEEKIDALLAHLGVAIKSPRA